MAGQERPVEIKGGMMLQLLNRNGELFLVIVVRCQYVVITLNHSNLDVCVRG